MSSRSYSSGAYRYWFNGKELDKDEEGMGGGGSTYDYGFRIYNPNLGKFLSVDPLKKEYPWNCPYSFAENRVIEGVDLDGLEFYKKTIPETGKTWWFYEAPINSGSPTQGWDAYGQPYAIGSTMILTVSFKQDEKGNIIPICEYTKIDKNRTNTKSQSLPVNQNRKLQNGGIVKMIKFDKDENRDRKNKDGQVWGPKMTGIKIEINYKSKNPKCQGIYYLQTIYRDNSNPTSNRIKNHYDASDEKSPFYFSDALGGSRNFEDNSGFSGEVYKNITTTFKASIMIYEKVDNIFTAVAVVNYSYTVEFDKNGKGKIVNMKSELIDLSCN